MGGKTLFFLFFFLSNPKSFLFDIMKLTWEGEWCPAVQAGSVYRGVGQPTLGFARLGREEREVDTVKGEEEKATGFA